ncbi:uncharacterized protein LOC116778425 [Danaus plexippus]|uniref:uncharacterized protein LOC116778425 n=1 Tax=Danaus plexippus TaxID=13037 RepID=UPI002AB02CEE|nr:uncharacterized protein LOC116778425 [Danaus plexippus]XP_032528320.2 uncharacterized protein LOC116778425 [Danaus plexippus]
MSSKNQQTKRTPRAMPVETIITRYKSAQQKKTQEPEQKKVIRNNKKNKTAKKPALPQNEKKNRLQEMKQLIENTEFHPNKHKRHIKPKKIVLIPKNCLKMVGGTKSSNKRKLHIPRKEPSNTLSDALMNSMETNSNISFPELIRVIEESGSLDDEDFLEILTCPSPVWWEDPPHGYMEEALYSRSPEEDKSRCQNEEKTDNVGCNLANDLVINVIDRSKNFIKKRGKLETLLKNMREKITKPEIDNQKNSDRINDDCSMELRDDEVLKHLENIKIPIAEDDKAKTSDEDFDKNMPIDEEYLDMSYFEDSYEDIKDISKTEAKQERYFKQIQKDKDRQEEYVAVYKIIESDDDADTNDGNMKEKQISSYYRQKKFKSKSNKCSCYMNKSIKVSDSVKYCLVCSSINDTDECKYCMGKFTGKCVCDRYTCDVCNVRVESKRDLVDHLKHCVK